MPAKLHTQPRAERLVQNILLIAESSADIRLNDPNLAPVIGTRAFYQYFQRNNIIYIDENLSHHEQMFECAHEMGHMFLHKKANSIFMDTRTGFITNRYEKEADTFAMDLLVADNILSEYQEYSMEQLSRLLGYEQRLIELRLKNFNI